MSSLLQHKQAGNAIGTVPTQIERIVLIGFMGAGKSTVGRLLAKHLDWEFRDTDSDVEARYGCTIEEMFKTEGEDTFRRRESVAIARALGRRYVVIAVGGGALETLTNRLLLEQTAGTTVVFLDAPFDVLFDRCVLQEASVVRPVLANPAAAAERFLARTPLYRRCAHFFVLTSESAPVETMHNLLQVVATPPPL